MTTAQMTTKAQAMKKKERKVFNIRRLFSQYPIVIQPKELAKVATPTTQTKHEVYDVVFVSYGFICFRKIWVICLYAIMLDKTMFKALL